MDIQPQHQLEKEGIMNGLLELFGRPFPVMEDWQMRWVVILFHGIFVSIFLVLFKPFQDLLLTDSFIINVGFGLVVSAVLAFNHFLISKILPFDLKKWTIGKSIAWTMYDVLTVIIAVFIYKNYWTDFAAFTWNDLWRISYSTLLLAIIPVMISTILLENWLLRRNLKRASQLQKTVQKSVQVQKPSIQKSPISKSNADLLTLYADNKNEWFKIRPKDLILLESSDNYVCIYYLDKEKVQKKLIRSTLTKLEAQIELPAIFRCHRSFMVNLHQIKQVNGNSRGLQLDLLDLEQTIPVSRKYVKEIQAKLEQV